jgi:uncharacterized protein
MAGFLVDGDEQAPATVLLAHGAGAPTDSPWMDAVAKALAAAGLRAIRLVFAYMAARRAGTRKPPPRADLLVPQYRHAIAQLGAEAPLIIGGKSMGARVASLVADEMYAAGKTAGLLCVGYPFHPLGKPAQPRTGHLRAAARRTLPSTTYRTPRSQATNLPRWGLAYPMGRTSMAGRPICAGLPKDRSGSGLDHTMFEVVVGFGDSGRPLATTPALFVASQWAKGSL